MRMNVDPESILAAMLPKRSGAPKREFSPEQDAALLKYRPIRTWEQLHQAFGLSENTLRRRYRELKDGKGK